MEKNIPTKLSDYIAYPFLIPNINIDFNIGKEIVSVNTSMVVKPKSEESKKLILKGIEIELLSVSINGKELNAKEYNLTDQKLVIEDPPISEF